MHTQWHRYHFNGQMNPRYILIGLILLSSCDRGQEHYRTDQAFILIAEITSPDKNFKIVVYQFDNGAFGNSRIFWAITPSDNEKLNLADYLLPDGYKAFTWTDNNEALMEKWEPYKGKEVEL